MDSSVSVVRDPHGSPRSAAVPAASSPGGDIALLQDSLVRPVEKHSWLRYPVLQGLGPLGQALVLGIRALRYSAEAALDETDSQRPAKKKPQLNSWVLALNLAISVAFFIFFYKFLPLYLATQV